MSETRLDKESLRLLRAALERLDAGFARLPPLDASADESAAIERVLLEVAERLHDNYPYFHPLYAGQMLKPPHPVARLAYALAQWINPNNHALDGGRASSAMEKEAVADLARMFGWQAPLGHLCGGGTMANSNHEMPPMDTINSIPPARLCAWSSDITLMPMNSANA